MLTGGAGFIGSNFVLDWLSKNYEEGLPFKDVDLFNN